MYLINKTRAVIDLDIGMCTYFNFGSTKRSHVVRIGTKEVTLLNFLVQRSGKLITKEEMLTTVWNGRVVCENTAVVALSNLRKLFRRVDIDCRCLVTIAGRGYMFFPERSGFYLEEDYDIQYS